MRDIKISLQQNLMYISVKDTHENYKTKITIENNKKKTILREIPLPNQTSVDIMRQSFNAGIIITI